MEEQITIVYKDTPTGFIVHPGLTSVHQKDAGLLLKEAWFTAFTLNDLGVEKLDKGFEVFDDGTYTVVKARGATWRKALDANCSKGFNANKFCHAYTKKLLGFAVFAESH